MAVLRRRLDRRRLDLVVDGAFDLLEKLVLKEAAEGNW